MKCNEIDMESVVGDTDQSQYGLAKPCCRICLGESSYV